MLNNLLKYSFNSFTEEKILHMGGRGVSEGKPYELLIPPTLPAMISPAIFRNRFFQVTVFAKRLQIFHFISAAIRQRNDVITFSILWKHHTTAPPALILVTNQHRFAQIHPTTTAHTFFRRLWRVLHGDSVLINRPEP